MFSVCVGRSKCQWLRQYFSRHRFARAAGMAVCAHGLKFIRSEIRFIREWVDVVGSNGILHLILSLQSTTRRGLLLVFPLFFYKLYTVEIPLSPQQPRVQHYNNSGIYWRDCDSVFPATPRHI